MVDWTLIPQSRARRPDQTILFLDKVNIPITPPLEPETIEQSKKTVVEIWAFFWMMTAITIKYVIRNDDVFAAEWIEHLHGLLRDIERRIHQEPWKYTRGSLSSLQPGREEQLQTIRKLCNRILEQKERVSEFIGSEPLTPTAEIEALINLA